MFDREELITAYVLYIGRLGTDASVSLELLANRFGFDVITHGFHEGMRFLPPSVCLSVFPHDVSKADIDLRSPNLA